MWTDSFCILIPDESWSGSGREKKALFKINGTRTSLLLRT